MKKIRLFISSLAILFLSKMAVSQNVMVNILTQKSGIVTKNGIVFLEITINNTDPLAYIGIYRIKTQLSVPSAIASIAAEGHVLPTGWTITSQNDSVINLSNGKDMIAANDARTLLVAIRGMKMGGPSTISCQLSFSDGTSPGTAPGTLPGENPGDNRSTSTIEVTGKKGF
ncbi:MAG: hypothetical protein SGI83_11675 [Bacteroidota bacterium]|nr:hypothetical protein [Bacteroidota bacterium]